MNIGAGIGFVTVTERGPVRFRYEWIVLSKSGAGVRVALVTVAAEIETTPLLLFACCCSRLCKSCKLTLFNS